MNDSDILCNIKTYIDGECLGFSGWEFGVGFGSTRRRDRRDRRGRRGRRAAVTRAAVPAG